MRFVGGRRLRIEMWWSGWSFCSGVLETEEKGREVGFCAGSGRGGGLGCG